VDLDYQLDTAMTQILVTSLQNFSWIILVFSVTSPYKGRFETPKYSHKVRQPHFLYNKLYGVNLLSNTTIWWIYIYIYNLLFIT